MSVSIVSTVRMKLTDTCKKVRQHRAMTSLSIGLMGKPKAHLMDEPYVDRNAVPYHVGILVRLWPFYPHIIENAMIAHKLIHCNFVMHY